MTADKKYSYFSHRECEYFPCHPGADPENFNCLFCYCPLYLLGPRCGGDFVIRPNGRKDCSGCLYLQKTLEDEQGVNWPMAGVLPGTGYRTDRLRRFGYKELNVEGDSLIFRRGETVPAHEFHYWGCTEPGAVLTETLYAAFPHLHFGGELPLAERFVQRAVKWREEHER